MLNGDVLTDMDLTAELAQHEQHRRARDARADRGGGHVQLRRRARPTTTGGSRRSSRSRDGPAPTNRINAGAYVIEREVVEG